MSDCNSQCHIELNITQVMLTRHNDKPYLHCMWLFKVSLYRDTDLDVTQGSFHLLAKHKVHISI